jgi:dCMP deaminase
MELPWTKWDERFMERAKQIASWSKHPKHRVGAVIKDPLHRLVGEGYNGPPMFTIDAVDSEEELRMRSLHAELNAILHASRLDLKGCVMYVYPYAPCALCAAAIIQKQIREVIYFTDGPKDQLQHWRESQIVGARMLGEAGVILSAFI